MSFIANTRVMVLGLAIAQAAPMLAAPLLTRIFSPNAFGLQTLFMSTAAMFAVLGTLRLDLAIIVGADRREAARILLLGAIQTVAVTFIVAAGLVALWELSLLDLISPRGQLWLWLLAPMVLCLAISQLSGAGLAWEKRFAAVSFAHVANQAVYLAIALGFGAMLWVGEAIPIPETEILVISKLVGQLAVAALLIVAARHILRLARGEFPPKMATLWDRCRPFIIFNAPYSLVGLIGREVPIFAFSAVGALAAVGYYGLARSILGIPTNLLSASLSQVFFREAVERRGSRYLEALFSALLELTIRAPAPIYAFVIIWADVVFAYSFGADWDVAGNYAAVLAFAAWLSVQTCWPERLYETHNRQGLSFAIQISFDLAGLVVVLVALHLGATHLWCVALFAVNNSLFHLAYLTGMFRVAGYSLRMLVRSALGGVGIMGLSLALMLALRLAELPSVSGLALSALSALMIAAFLGHRGYRKVTAVAKGGPGCDVVNDQEWSNH